LQAVLCVACVRGRWERRVVDGRRGVFVCGFSGVAARVIITASGVILDPFVV
jgi:hypothetical protein